MATNAGHDAATISIKARESVEKARIPKHRQTAKVAARKKILPANAGELSRSSSKTLQPSIVVTERKEQASM